MRLLLDTHTLIWWIGDPKKLCDDARLAIANARNQVFVSPISFLEITIKEAIGKLKVAGDLQGPVEASRFTELPLTIAHVLAVRTLPLHHRDPFDRALLAVARVERLTLVSRDPMMMHYDVPLLAA